MSTFELLEVEYGIVYTINNQSILLLEKGACNSKILFRLVFLHKSCSFFLNSCFLFLDYSEFAKGFKNLIIELAPWC